MERSPPLSPQYESQSRSKSASRLTRSSQLTAANGDTIPKLSLDLVQSSPNRTPPPSPASPKPQSSVPLRELLLLPPSPYKRSKTSPSEKRDIMAVEALQKNSNGTKRKCKNRSEQIGLLGCASPRNLRRSRRRSELEMKEEKDLVVLEETGRHRKRRHSGKSKKEKQNLVPLLPSSSSPPGRNDDGKGCIDRLGQMISDLIMWKDVAKSSLWFGFGSLCFLSSCFSNGLNFSVFSMASQLGLLFLGVSFISNSIYQRDNMERSREFALKEEDILRMARVILPAANFSISKAKEVFSGEPNMTLRVAPFLLLGAEYGHLITLWRLFALGFFISFTGPKLYSIYSPQINKKVNCLKGWVLETWGACSHKKIVAASAATAFWNLSSVKTRIFTAFISMVILRYHKQSSGAILKEEEHQPQ